jgi:hypothetical protein
VPANWLCGGCANVVGMFRQMWCFGLDVDVVGYWREYSRGRDDEVLVVDGGDERILWWGRC